MWSQRTVWGSWAVLVLLCTMAGGDANEPTESHTEKRQSMAQIFTRESGMESFNYLVKLYQSHERLYDAFVDQSNLGQFDTGTNENPFTFLGGDASKLPSDAKITMSLTKEEFIALKMPSWDSMVLGGHNHIAFLKAWMAYQSYENARLRFELLEMKSPEGVDSQRSELQAEMAVYEKEIVTYLEREPAD